MTKRLAPTGVSKSASELEALQRDLAMNHPNDADDRDIDLMVAAGPADVSELVGWQPDLHLSGGGHGRCPPG
jgi:predicted MPP superfamily phosphohydrolase